MKKHVSLSILAGITSVAMVAPAAAQVSGAIYTSLIDGTEVNGNIYDAKEDVYLNGGPGKGAGSNAPGLSPDGTYVFMVTDPSGKTLLSTDEARCRQVTVVDGSFTGVVDTDCEHDVGTPPPVSGAPVPVQLIPYLDTPNNGGEYKAWLTPLASYTCDLDEVSCDTGTFGFINSESKTDNFKVRGVIDEIDTRFFDDTNQILDGRGIQWIDTHGASNAKYSYFAPEINVNHEAHVEAPEVGVHYIEISDQPGCAVQEVYVAGVKQKKTGPQTVPVRITRALKTKGTFTIFVDVHCH